MNNRFLTEYERNEINNIILSYQVKECERTKENDILGQIYTLLIKAQYIDDVELRKDAVNIIWATLMVHLKNKNMDNNNNG